VMGAFGRSMLSGFFKHSTAELIIKTVNLPVFVAHHK
jgi:nucleotide-binding universal stress UspA family protein